MKYLNHGVVISFEGDDASGKTSQIDSLRNWLEEEFGLNIKVLKDDGELTTNVDFIKASSIVGITPLDDVTKQLLYMAQTFSKKTIFDYTREEKNILIVDRAIDTMVVYGDMFSKGNETLFEDLDNIAYRYGPVPDITVLFKCKVETRIKRLVERGELSAQSDMTSYIERCVYLDEQFQILTLLYPERFIIVNTEYNKQQVAYNLRTQVMEWLTDKEYLDDEQP